MSTHDEIRTLADQLLRDLEQARIDSDARLKALNEQCDKLLAVIDAAQAGVKALNAKCDPQALFKIDDRGIVVGMADDGWIAWNGVGQPPTRIAKARFRNGETYACPATHLFWHHDGTGTDIVAYRVEW